MNFREYGEVKPITLTFHDKFKLDNNIMDLGNCYDIIDLQFATSWDANAEATAYSVIVLAKEKQE